LRIYYVFDTHSVKIALYLFKMLFAVIAKIIKHNRCTRCNIAAYRAFAVENTHRITLESALTCFAKFVLSCAEIFLERLVILGTACRTADGVYFKVKVCYSKLVKHLLCKRNHFRICKRRCCTETLNTELVEFAQSACLRLFISVTRCEIANLLRQCLVAKSVFQKRTSSACSTLGAQCN